MEMRWPSKDTTFNWFSLTLNNSPAIILLLSFGEIEKIVCWITSFKVNWDRLIYLFFSI